MIASLQSLRFVFVMLIFLSHFAYREIPALDAGGDCGVAFFFLLSGFVCSFGYGKQIADGTFSYRKFLSRRFRKIYPLHLLFLVICLIISKETIGVKVLVNALLLQSWIPYSDWYFSCNSVSWFLSSLLFCYLLFPLAYKYLSRRLTIIVIVAYSLIFIATPYGRINAVLYVFPVTRFVDFYLGMLLYKVYKRRHDYPLSPWAEIVILLLLLLSLALYPFADERLRNAPLYWLVLIPLVFVFVREQGPVSRLLNSRYMVFLGTLSMPLFISHKIIIDLMVHRMPVIPAPMMLAVCVFVALTVSWMINIIFSRLFRL